MSLQGSFETIALRDVMALLASSNKSGELRVVGGHVEGRLWMQDGRLVGSKVGKSHGHVDALFELLRLTEGNFVFKDGVDAPAPEEPTMVEPVMREAEQRLAEWQDIQLVIPSLEHRVCLIPDLPTPDVTLSADEWRLVMAVAMAATVRGVLEELDLGQFEGCRGIRRLVDAGLAVVEAPRVRPAFPEGARLARRAAAAVAAAVEPVPVGAGAPVVAGNGNGNESPVFESSETSEPELETGVRSPRTVHRPPAPAMSPSLMPSPSLTPSPAVLGLTAGLAPGLSSRLSAGLSSGLSSGLSWGDASDLSVEHPAVDEVSAINAPSPFEMPGLGLVAAVSAADDHDESEAGTEPASDQFEDHLATVHHLPRYEDDDEVEPPLASLPEPPEFSFAARPHDVDDDESDALHSAPAVDDGQGPAPAAVTPASRDGGVDTINRGLLLKFLSSVRT